VKPGGYQHWGVSDVVKNSRSSENISVVLFKRQSRKRRTLANPAHVRPPPRQWHRQHVSRDLVRLVSGCHFVILGPSWASAFKIDTGQRCTTTGLP
jgi:hypothetical protein